MHANAHFIETRRTRLDTAAGNLITLPFAHENGEYDKIPYANTLPVTHREKSPRSTHSPRPSPRPPPRRCVMKGWHITYLLSGGFSFRQSLGEKLPDISVDDVAFLPGEAVQ